MAVLLACRVCQAAAQASGDPDKVPVIQLSIHPAAIGNFGDHHLVTPYAERKRGNAALQYYRAILAYLSTDKQVGKESWYEGLFGEWITAPDDKVPWEEVQKGINAYQRAFSEVQDASRREDCDWQFPLEGGFYTILDEVQQARQIGRLLTMKARLEVHNGQFDEALVTIRGGLTLARHLGNDESSVLVASLVGLALRSMMTGAVESFIEAPGAPNLYWALTELPVPFVDLRNAMEQERAMTHRQFPEIHLLQSSDPVSLEQARRITDAFLREWMSLENSQQDEAYKRAKSLEIGLLFAGVYPEAKKALATKGIPADVIERMPAQQVVMQHALDVYDAAFNDQLKWFYSRFPDMQRAALAGRLTSVPLDSHADSFIAALLVPAGQAAIQAAARTDRDIAMLRAVEAIRGYAAKHGSLPQRLAIAGIEEVSVPFDPFRNAPFEYTSDGTNAKLSSPPIEGGTPFTGRIYELRLVK